MVLRITRHEMLMQMAEVIAQRGTCDRAQVGAVASRKGRIIATGYNGAPAGLPHCDHAGDAVLRAADPLDGYPSIDVHGRLTYKSDLIAASNLMVGCTKAVHAEANLIAFSARHGVALEASDLYVTHMPCINCARLIVNAGVERVIWKEPYRLTEGVELLEQAGILVFDLRQLVD